MGNLIGGKDDKMSYKFKITRGNAILNFSERHPPPLADGKAAACPCQRTGEHFTQSHKVH